MNVIRDHIACSSQAKCTLVVANNCLESFQPIVQGGGAQKDTLS